MQRPQCRTAMQRMEMDQPLSHRRDLKAVLRLLKYRIYSENPKLVSMLVGAQKTLPV